MTLYYLADEPEGRLVFEKRMRAGCLTCDRSGGPGVVCPDCYSCVKCGPGCVECRQYRLKRASQQG
jgi:hypothetical protein